MATKVDRPGAQQWVPAERNHDDLALALQGCRGCELWSDATQAVMGEGRDGADLALVGEQPGDNEDQQGRPFVGPAGRLLADALAQAGIDPQRTYRTNAVKHFRHEGVRGGRRIHKNPGQAHITACSPWLAAEMDVVRPVGVVLLGATAGKALLGTSFRVGEMRGRLTDWPAELPGHHRVEHVPDWVLPTAHPSSVLRSQQRDEDMAALVADLQVAAAALAE